MPKYMQIALGLALICLFVYMVAIGTTRCEKPLFERGDIVTHRLTGDRAIIGSRFCSGGGESRKRMYEVTTSEVTTGPVYWGQYEIQR